MTLKDIFKESEQEKKQLQESGAKDIKSYCLVTNDGYTFTKKGSTYDLRHVLNCYGLDVDYYSLYCKQSTKTFDTFQQAINYIKTL